MFTIDQRGVIAGRRCAGVNTLNETCKCLCQAVTSRNLYRIYLQQPDWSGREEEIHGVKTLIPMPSVGPISVPNGRDWDITLPSGGGDFGAFDSKGHCSIYPVE